VNFAQFNTALGFRELVSRGVLNMANTLSPTPQTWTFANIVNDDPYVEFNTDGSILFKKRGVYIIWIESPTLTPATVDSP
jgi:hypothetical protein